MNKILIGILLIANSIYSQKSNQDILSFEIDTVRNEYTVRVGNLGTGKSQVVVEMKCFTSITDYKGKINKIEVMHANQKINNDGNVFFGGKLRNANYIITLSYLEKGKKIIKTIERNVNKS